MISLVNRMMRIADCQTMVESAHFGLMVEVAAFEHVEVAFHRLIEPGFHIQRKQKGIQISCVCFQEKVEVFLRFFSL